MSKLDDSIENVAYILDSLMVLRNIYESGCCNDCKIAKTCEYAPKVGQLVRYNCPFYERREEMINDNIRPINPTNFRFPTKTEMAISETLKLCGISGEDASMMFIEVMKKLGKSDEIPPCCRGLAEKK